VWNALSTHTLETDVTVTVRAAAGGESQAHFQIAPVAASGSIVFWAANPAASDDREVVDRSTATELRGFSLGDESTTPVLKVAQVQQPSTLENGVGRHVVCMGCHAATPDSSYIAFVDDWPWNLVVAGVKPGVVGNQLNGLTPGGLAALNLPWGGMMAFSARLAARPAHGRRPVGLVDYDAWQNSAKPAKLFWYNLDAPAPATVGMPMPGAVRRGGARVTARRRRRRPGATTARRSSTPRRWAEPTRWRPARRILQRAVRRRRGRPATPLAGASEPRGGVLPGVRARRSPHRLQPHPRGREHVRQPADRLSSGKAAPHAAAANDRPRAQARRARRQRLGPLAVVQNDGGKRYYWLLSRIVGRRPPPYRIATTTTGP
jgi:hypothetical protein